VLKGFKEINEFIYMALTMNTINEEWAQFILQKGNEESSDDDDETYNNDIISANMSEISQLTGVAPSASDIYISTKSKIAYLNQEIDLKKIFWGIQVIPYSTPKNGVIKKQMKFNSMTQEELDEITSNLKNELYFDEQIITSINNPNGRIKFKDIRKVSVGISKKDIMSYRCKRKSAFYNCFVMILRIKMNEVFREFHIKVFNTGKLEIPGIQTEEMFETVLETILFILKPFTNDDLSYLQKSDTVLINSNFSCGFYINREALYDILKFKYNIQCIYDPCSYPGVQCKFYYNHDLPPTVKQTGSQISEEEKSQYKNITAVSFMIFRTGSVLIVGMCDEEILHYIYNFLKELLSTEFNKVGQMLVTAENTPIKEKSKKIRKKTIIVDC
jgi:hypothetical protein